MPRDAVGTAWIIPAMQIEGARCGRCLHFDNLHILQEVSMYHLYGAVGVIPYRSGSYKRHSTEQVGERTFGPAP